MPEHRGPLAGITVVALEQAVSAPMCTRVLADFGARVIKVERPGTGDDSRAFGPFMNGKSLYFASIISFCDLLKFVTAVL